ncbi:MAG: hypothetical protein COV10_03180 [Candidatus Vogelbacteria bacterium CG10_big_fil_rev_8_21_14_0_10_51_16]|uniref:Uncharacterized protein n=1 Tax=Candidatus Vogelbacteria bacterium CG10_big_fil_rev_8_21_14_0_10_51_16 TaxID=1975045 RepID=A0A2H0RFD2_9BACT|nr:MAG: hypothetical protein COV10_03180 [Candidatus Vogelbacteria bacterium CG10_big_fil_rev_8_21_14_0_10_51_16]
MVNFVTIIPKLVDDVMTIISRLGFKPHLYQNQQSTSLKYTVRVSRDTEKFVATVRLSKD